MDTADVIEISSDDAMEITDEENNDCVIVECEDRVEGPRCPICLNAFTDPRMLDVCFHTYCYLCIMQWTSVSRSCPLCKEEFSSLIKVTNDDTNDYERVYLDDAKALSTVPSTSGRSRRKKYTDTQFRAMVYSKHMQPIIDFDLVQIPFGPRAHDSFPHKAKDYLQQRQNNWLSKFSSWLTRELDVLLDSQHADQSSTKTLLLQVIEKMLIKYGNLNEQKVYEQLHGFLEEHTSQFISEAMLFLQSPYTLAQFDRQVNYQSQHGTIYTGKSGKWKKYKQ